MSAARIAILGIQLEANAWAAPTTLRDVQQYGLLVGAALRELIIQGNYGFDRGLSPFREWQPVPILLARPQSGGPLEQQAFEFLVNRIRDELKAAGPLDGVYIDAHGAGTTGELADMDGEYFEAVRDIVGPNVPIAATLDLHGNVSAKMVRNTDLMIAQRTNPHLDTADRRAEVGRLFHRLLNGERLYQAHIRIPLLTPQVTQLTARTEPLGELMHLLESKIGRDAESLSLLPGFALSDTPDNGMAVLAYDWRSQARADAAAADIGAAAWRSRDRFQRSLASIEQSVARTMEALASDGAPIILADVADNPGGGGASNTVWILKALHAAGASGVQVGLFYDPTLVDEAWRWGPGARFLAHFNHRAVDELSGSYSTMASIEAIREVRFIGRRGLMAGAMLDLGRTCVIDIGGIRVAVVSIRQQLFEPAALEACGMDTSRARCFVVKSRGHFRAGFDQLVKPADIIEVDAPGLTTPHLARLAWNRLTRPIYPLDRMD